MNIKILIVLIFSTIAVASSQDLSLTDGYYRIDSGESDFAWVLQFDSKDITFYVDGEIAFKFGDLEQSSLKMTGDTIKFSFLNPKAPEWHEHHVSISKSGEDFEVDVSYSVMEYSDFLEKSDMTPKGYSTSYFRGPMKKEEAFK